MTRTRLTPECKVLLFFRSAAIAFGLLFAWTARQSSNPDAICYLDLSDAFRSGHWNGAINAIWCPLYPALLAMASFLLHPSAYWVFPVVHLVNVAVFLCALASFEFLLSGLRERRRQEAPRLAREGLEALPESSWTALCYVAFLYGILSLIQLLTVTPDLCVGTIVLLATGLIIRIQNGDVRARTFAVLGLVLGLGYFSKTIMLFMGIVFLGLGVCAAQFSRKALPGILSSVVIFLLTISLFMIPLFRSKHRFTFGDIGRIRYAWSVLHLENFPQHPEGIPGHGVPLHPYRILVDEPRVYEFGSHIAGTYSPAFDMSYWFEGLTFTQEPLKQLPVLWKSIKVYAGIAQVEWSLVLGLMVLYGLRGRNAHWLEGVASNYVLLLPSLIAFGIFGLMQAEGRYVGSYVALFIMGIVSGVRLHKGSGSARWIRPLVLAMLIGPVVNVMHGAGSYIKFEWRVRQGLQTPRCLLDWEVSQALQSSGIKEGDRVASLGTSYGAYWARLAKTHIVAEAPDADQFWTAPPASQQRVLKAFQTVGVRAVVGQTDQPEKAGAGWRQVGRTDYYVYLLNG